MDLRPSSAPPRGRVQIDGQPDGKIVGIGAVQGIVAR
jgi:hypothetical protein